MLELNVLSLRIKLARKLLKARIKKGLSQRQVAALAGFAQPYLAQIESGIRPLSRKAAGQLESIYGVKTGQFAKGTGMRGRPALWPKTAAAMRDFRQAIQQFWKVAEVRIPKHQQPHQVRRSGDPLWPMSIHLGPQAGEEVRQLEKLRGMDDCFWRQFNSLRFDSWSEKRLLVGVALLGGQMIGLRLKDLGCKLDLRDGVTGRAPGLHRGFVLKGQTASLIWCPQVAIRTRRGHRCVDNLLTLRGGGKTISVAVEVNGKPFHNAREQRRRDAELGIPVLHIDADRVGKPGLIREILQWAHQQLVEAA